MNDDVFYAVPALLITADLISESSVHRKLPSSDTLPSSPTAAD
jgi:hypothetical protein